MTQARHVEARLREMIISMEIGPGERLTERWAEGQFGASRTPVRAALLRLEAEGLICREGRGWMAAPLDMKEIEQLFVYREVLEVAAVQLAVKVAKPEHLDVLESAIGQSGQNAPTREAHACGTQFHMQLAVLSANHFIARGVADTMTRLSRVRWLGASAAHDGRHEHHAALAALRNGDGTLAAAIIAAHIRDSRTRVLKMLTESHRSLRARGVGVEPRCSAKTSAV